MAGMHVQSTFLWKMACEARDRAKESYAKNPKIYAWDAIPAVVLSAATTEAFINELVQWIEITLRGETPPEPASG